MNNDKRACKALYFSLQNADQIDLQTKFMEAGISKMKDLIFYNDLPSTELRKGQANMLSVKNNNDFKKINLASFENGETETTGVSIALLKRGLQLPDHTSKIYSNLNNDKAYDQIAFFPVPKA